MTSSLPKEVIMQDLTLLFPYRAFVQDNSRGASPWKEVRGQVLLGSETFREKLAPLFTKQADVQEIPQLQRFAARPSLDKILSGKWTTKAQRNQAIRRAYLRYGYTLRRLRIPCPIRHSSPKRVRRARYTTPKPMISTLPSPGDRDRRC